MVLHITDKGHSIKLRNFKNINCKYNCFFILIQQKYYNFLATKKDKYTLQFNNIGTFTFNYFMLHATQIQRIFFRLIYVKFLLALFKFIEFLVLITVMFMLFKNMIVFVLFFKV